MEAGSLVELRGSMYSSYQYQGEQGLLLEVVSMANRSGYPEAEFGRVMWFKDSVQSLIKIKHLEVIS